MNNWTLKQMRDSAIEAEGIGRPSGGYAEWYALGDEEEGKKFTVYASGTQVAEGIRLNPRS